MEVYYKDLISEEASLEKLVDDLTLVVQGADAFVEEAAANLPGERRQEIAGRLARLKQSYRRVKDQTVAGAVAADKVLRRYPYYSLALAFGLGLLAGTLLSRKED
jgi:ElaB/YqjD/DUF883 family membrane-anchored ribosome-binding protein